MKVSRGLHYWNLTLACLTIITASIATIVLVKECKQSPLADTSFHISDSHTIDLTPEQITSIKNIGKWEFLSMDMEEMVDTIHHRTLLSDEELVRIYRGTARLGTDMTEVSEGWLTTNGDTATLVMPRIRLLNKKFIDEANTRTFTEKGSWDAKAREALYKKTERKMLLRLKQNDAYAKAEESGRAQMTALMKAIGFNTVKITFE